MGEKNRKAEFISKELILEMIDREISGKCKVGLKSDKHNNFYIVQYWVED